MLQYVPQFLAAAAAWSTVSTLLHQNWRTVATGGLLTGTLLGILLWLLDLIRFPLDLSPVLLVLLILLIPFSRKCHWSTRLEYLAITLGLWALLRFWENTLLAFFATGWILALSLLAAGIFLAAAWLLGKYLPYNRNSDLLPKTLREQAKDRLPVWLALSLMALAEVSLLYAIEIPSALSSALWLIAAYTILGWGALYGVCLSTAFHQERITALVEQDYRQEMQSFLNIIRSQRHDYNFHVQALSGLLKEGSIEECRRYLDNLVADSARLNTVLPVKDPAVAALIFSFQTMASEQDITLHLEIKNDLADVVTNVYETNKIIGNLLQNAIDEVSTHTDKSYGIHLHILKRGEDCVIRVSNKLTHEEDIRRNLQAMYQPGYSSKEGHEGIGLCSIQNLLKPHRGVVYSRLEHDIIHVVAKIPLTIQGEYA